MGYDDDGGFLSVESYDGGFLVDRGVHHTRQVWQGRQVAVVQWVEGKSICSDGEHDLVRATYHDEVWCRRCGGFAYENTPGGLIKVRESV